MADQGYRSQRNSSLRGSRRKGGKGKKTSARRAVVLTLSLPFYDLPRRLQEQLQTLKNDAGFCWADIGRILGISERTLRPRTGMIVGNFEHDIRGRWGLGNWVKGY